MKMILMIRNYMLIEIEENKKKIQMILVMKILGQKLMQKRKSFYRNQVEKIIK
jgi:hypothetical protein